jgi:hypothetical protein
MLLQLFSNRFKEQVFRLATIRIGHCFFLEQSLQLLEQLLARALIEVILLSCEKNRVRVNGLFKLQKLSGLTGTLTGLNRPFLVFADLDEPVKPGHRLAKSANTEI